MSDNKTEFSITKQDALKSIYFICKKAQNQNGHAMIGVLSNKKDYIGGIFDRWINIIPESVIFNKGIFPPLSNGKKVEVVTDYYCYNPLSDMAGIAPDVIGIKVDNRIIPFSVYNDGWEPCEDMPQIEIKTFKQADYMASLRDQKYGEKYLCMVESNFRIDYLVPFFDNNVFSNDVFSQMEMDDSIFIKNNKKGYITRLEPIDNDSNIIGTVKIILITRADYFKKIATKCESGVSVEFLKSIEQIPDVKYNELLPLTSICEYYKNSLYRFTEKWYSGIEDDIPYRETKKKTGTIVRKKVRSLDFYVDDINSIQLVKCNKMNLIIKTTNDCIFNGYKLTKNKYYKIIYSCLDRGNNGEEYFIQKDNLKYIDSFEDELKGKIKKIIG